MRTLTIARGTFREAIRQRVLIITLLLGVVAIILSPVFAQFFLDDTARYDGIRQMCVADTLIVGIICAIFSASAVVADEIENKTVVTLLAKPVSRYQVIIGKYLGILMALVIPFIIMIIVASVTVMWTEANYPDGRGNPALAVTDAPTVLTGQDSIAVGGIHKNLFSSRQLDKLDHLFSFGDVLLLVTGQSNTLTERAPFSATSEQIQPRLPGLALITDSVFTFLGNRQTRLFAQAFILSFAQIMILTAAAVAVSTRVSLIFTALTTIGVFVFGNLSSILGQTLAEEHVDGILSVLRWPVIALCSVFPDLNILDLTDPLQVGSSPVDFTRVVGGFGYGLLYTAAILILGILLFQRREVT